MKQWQRLIFYLVLNILVSACTVVGILFLWDQVYGPLPKGLLTAAFERIGAATATPQAPAAENPAVPQPTPTEAYLVHQVVSGETFESIAKQYNMSVEELLAVNGFNQPQVLGDGEVLRIPAKPKGSVFIDRVVAAGDLEKEMVVLKHRGDGELSLVGWRLQDNQGHEFVFPEFPQLTLFGGGAVNVYTKAGANSVVELFWGLDKAIWRSGSTVTLIDSQGMTRATYKIP